MASIQRVFADLGLTLVERGWLSSNNIVFRGCNSVPATVIDTGYVSQSEQTVELVRRMLGNEPLRRIVNTHLHSDHCGGNAGLSEHCSTEILVPEASFDAARRWDQSLLTFGETGQRCDRFNVDVPLRAESEIRLGAATWRVIAAKGHDPNAVMLFEPVSRILISADALWEARLAIVFPEVDGVGGFGETRATLDLIGELQPRLVIPGHGPAFTDVARALDRSLDKLALFERHPERHLHYATRALTMFHMLDVRGTTRKELSEWLQATPIFARLHLRLDAQRMDLGNFSASVVEQLIADGLLMQFGDCEISLHSA